jgi:hypothetical protein
MSAGVLIYCFNSEQVQYHRTTNFCIELIKKNLSLPTTVVTNSATKEHIKGADSLVVIENQKNNIRFYKDKTIPWYNLERSSAYDHSPYDTTVLLDSDYFVYTKNLLELIDSHYEFLLHNRVHDLTGRGRFEYNNSSMIPLVWATVTVFKKTERVKKIFDMIKHIQQNYSYFCKLYRIDFANFRNDYAFAMALNQIDGFNQQYFMPTAMSMIPTDTKVLKIDHTGIVFQYDKFVNLVTEQDVHVLDKEIPINV